MPDVKATAAEGLPVAYAHARRPSIGRDPAGPWCDVLARTLRTIEETLR